MAKSIPLKRLLLLTDVVFIMQGAVSAQSCLPEGISFTNQAQIDSFQFNYPGCTEIEGDVEIYGDDISNLYGLSALASIGKTLSIGSYDSNNPNLTDLAGLDRLITIGGDLEIRGNNALASLVGLENLNSIGGSVGIGKSLWESGYGNPVLTSLKGLDNLTVIGGYLAIVYNDALANVTGLENLTTLAGGLYVHGNRSLTNVSGLENLTTIWGDLEISSNHALKSLIGLEKLTSLGGDFAITTNNALSSLTDFENITYINGDLLIASNDALTSITGLENVTSIGGNLDIWWNDSLINITGLRNLTSIGRTLNIHVNPALTRLTSLENVTSIGGNLYIRFNTLLSICEVQSICDYLDNPSGDFDIRDNASGCNSQTEVEEACMTVDVSDINIEFEYSIYPNPVTSEIYISAESRTTIDEAILYNQMGQVVLHRDRIDHAIDVSMLPPGIYVVELVSDAAKVRTRVVIL